MSAAATAAASDSFAGRLLAWFDVHGRHGLPWQAPRTAYRVWLSEVMLQQTQVATVIPYFERFVARFPDFTSLAAADIDEVLALWAGLGYYARGRNLHAAAKQVVSLHRGDMPDDIEAAQALPGVGRSTAAAILAQAYGSRHAILDGNVKRVLARHAAIPGWPGEPKVAAKLWMVSERHLPQTRLADYTQAIMDLGATLCSARQPSCERCPVAADCAASLAGRIDEFPASKPAKARPLRRQQLLVVEDAEGAILIERRPPAGIWGGLWCLPVAAEGEAIDELLRAAHGIEIEQLETLPSFRHAFTHFELELQPQRCRLRAEATAAMALRERPEQRWLNMRRDPLPGLPAPVLQFLNTRLRADDDPCPEPSTASSSARKPKASTAPRSPASSARSSTSKSPRKPGPAGSRTRPA